MRKEPVVRKTASSFHDTPIETSPEHATPSLDGGTLSLLLPRILAVSFVVVVVATLLRGNTGALNLVILSATRLSRAKTFDHVMYVLDGASAALIAIIFLRTKRQHAVVTILCSLIATGGIIIGILSIEEPTLVQSHILWSGFGIGDLVFVLVISPFIWKLFEWRSLNVIVRRIIAAFVFAVCIVDVISLIRTVDLVVISGNDIYMLNEMLTQAAGKVPGSNFIPLYENMYGWLLKPFTHHMSVRGLVNFACLVFTACSIAAVGLGVLIAHRAFGRRSLTVAALLVIPISCASVFHNPTYNIADAFQYTPIRIFPGMLLGAFAIEELVRIRRGMARNRALVLLGVLSGVTAWSNQDFALVSVFVLGLLLLLSSGRKFSGYKPFACWIAGLGTFTAVYAFVLAATGTPVSLRYLFVFQSVFAHGFYEYPVQVPGPVLIVMPLILSAGVIGWFMLWEQRRCEVLDRAANAYGERAALTAAFFGSWCAVTFFYYLNRSIAAGQLQIFLLPAGVLIASLAAMALRPGSEMMGTYIPWRFSSSSLQDLSTRVRALSLIPITLFAALPLATTLQTPNPIKTFQVILNPPPGVGVVWPSTAGLQATFNAMVKSLPVGRRKSGSVAYYGQWGNYVTLATGIPSLAIGDIPPVDGTGPTSTDCKYLMGKPVQILILDPPTVAQYGTSVCGIFQQTTPSAYAPWVVYRKA